MHGFAWRCLLSNESFDTLGLGNCPLHAYLGLLGELRTALLAMLCGIPTEAFNVKPRNVSLPLSHRPIEIAQYFTSHEALAQRLNVLVMKKSPLPTSCISSLATWKYMHAGGPVPSTRLKPYSPLEVSALLAYTQRTQPSVLRRWKYSIMVAKCDAISAIEPCWRGAPRCLARTIAAL